MKIKFFAFALSAAAVSFAAPLASTTAVHVKPDPASPAITVLNAGTDPTPAGAVPNTPAGWMAIELPGPFEVWIETKDLTKNLDVKPGASMRLAPRIDAGVIAVGQPGDKSVIVGYKGRWTQISLEKKLVGYINVGRSAGAPPVATTPAPAPSPTPKASTPSAPAPVAPAPVAPSVYGAGAIGQPAPMVNLGDGGASTLPRQFVGRLASTQSAFRPRRPYDYALNDEAGKRYAYVDVSKLLQTEQIEKFVDRPVVVFGAAKNTPDGKDIVIVAESLQLK